MIVPETVTTKRVKIAGQFGPTHALIAGIGNTYCGKALKSSFAIRSTSPVDALNLIPTICPDCATRVVSGTPKPYARRR